MYFIPLFMQKIESKITTWLINILRVIFDQNPRFDLWEKTTGGVWPFRYFPTNDRPSTRIPMSNVHSRLIIDFWSLWSFHIEKFNCNSWCRSLHEAIYHKTFSFVLFHFVIISPWKGGVTMSVSAICGAERFHSVIFILIVKSNPPISWMDTRWRCIFGYGHVCQFAQSLHESNKWPYNYNGAWVMIQEIKR